MFARDDSPDQEHQKHQEHQANQELIDAYVVELDPVLDGFYGIVVELCVFGTGVSRSYEVRQSALASGTRLLVFSSCEEGLARAVFDGELGYL